MKTIPPFYTNKNKEIVRAPKIYFVDTGARNYFLKNFTRLNERTETGFLVENFVLSQILKKADFLTEIKYWRDKNGREIDFVVQRENALVAYEVKTKVNLTRKDLANLQFFKKNYPQAEATLLSWIKPHLMIAGINEKELLEIAFQ